MIEKGNEMEYRVTVTELESGKAETLIVEGDSYTDAALTAAETPYELWTTVR